MAINRAEINNFHIFEGAFAADFGPGVNLFVGGNGEGKTTLMKAIYMACDKENPISGSTCTVYGINHPCSPVFIPTEVGHMLSHSKSFLALVNESEMPFDKIIIDLLLKAALPAAQAVSIHTEAVIESITAVIGGEVIHKDGVFYVKKEQGKEIPFLLEASGFRKFGLLWKLLRNGLLEPGSILFWDEPENSLNPELVPRLVTILLALARNSVQIFITTHDYNLARYFDIRKDKNIPVMYHNLSKTETSEIICESSPKYVTLPNNLLEKASADLFNAVVANAMGIPNYE